MVRTTHQAAHCTITVVGCQVADGRDGDEVFVVWRRGVKDKNSGTSERLVLKDGATCENFAPFSMDVTLSKDKSGQWEPKYVSISVKLVSQPKKEDTKAVKSDSKADAKSKKLSAKPSVTKVKDVKAKLIGKTIVNLADFAADKTNTLKNIPLKSKSTKTGSMDIRFETNWTTGADDDKEDDSSIQASAASEASEKSTDQQTEDTQLNTEMDLITDSEFVEEGDTSLVPPLIADCIRYLSENALKVEGLFRISGVVNEIAKIMKIYEAGYVAKFEDASPHSVSGALKLYLRSLPDPILTFQLYPKWMEAIQKEKDINQFKQIVSELLKQMPPSNLETLSTLAYFLNRVGAEHQINKMTLDNLAVVFAPSLLWSPVPHIDVNDLMNETFLLKGIALYFISHPKELFKEPEETALDFGRIVSFEEFDKLKENENKKREKERREMKKLEKGSILVNKTQMKKLRTGHYTQKKYEMKFNLLCLARVPQDIKNAHPKVALKWEKRGDSKKSGQTAFVSLQPTHTTSATPLYAALYTKSALASALSHGKKDSDAEDHALANTMKVTFFKSNRTNNYIKKPLKLCVVSEGADGGGGGGRRDTVGTV